jgi:hypothetical protein
LALKSKDFEMLVYLQPIAVLATSEPPSGEIAGITKSDRSVTQQLSVEALTSNQIFRTAFSSIPVVWKSELGQKYQELGEALSQMTELEEGSEWRIDPPVYGAACFVAAGLMVTGVPAPRVFNHGPKSVVFNWSDNTNNLYLTVSADAISALVSSPERIQRRIELVATEALNPALLFSTIQSGQLARPAPLRLTGTVSDLSEVVG